MGCMFCTRCGKCGMPRSQPAAGTCPVCGQLLPPTASVCPNCHAPRVAAVGAGAGPGTAAAGGARTARAPQAPGFRQRGGLAATGDQRREGKRT